LFEIDDPISQKLTATVKENQRLKLQLEDYKARLEKLVLLISEKQN